MRRHHEPYDAPCDSLFQRSSHSDDTFPSVMQCDTIFSRPDGGGPIARRTIARLRAQERTPLFWRCLAAACRSATKWPLKLELPLDIFVVRKLGVPGHRELAMGAIASGGIRVLNEDVLRALPEAAAMVAARSRPEDREELERRERDYRGTGPRRK